MEQAELQVKIGQHIEKLRKEKKISQVKFAYMLDIDKQSLNRLERGRANVSISRLLEIANLLEIPIQKLFDWK